MKNKKTRQNMGSITIYIQNLPGRKVGDDI